MKTNLDLARECGAHAIPTAIQEAAEALPMAVFFQSEAQLDDFAERIRADAMAEYAVMTTKGAKAWADAPNATAWVDELRGGGVSAPERRPLTDEQLAEVRRLNELEPVSIQAFRCVARAIERHHGITGDGQ